MELSQLCLQLTLQQTHALGGTGRDRRGSTISPLSHTLSLCLLGTHPSPLCTLDAREWPQPSCPGPHGSLGTRWCRHGPCCRHHPGDAAGHSMPHRARRSGQVSGVAVGGLRLTTGVAHPGPSIPISLKHQPRNPHMYSCMLHMYLAGMELQPSHEAFNGLDLLGERCVRKSLRPKALYPPP